MPFTTDILYLQEQDVDAVILAAKDLLATCHLIALRHARDAEACADFSVHNVQDENNNVIREQDPKSYSVSQYGTMGSKKCCWRSLPVD